MNRFIAIAYNEILLNLKRVAPYALMIMFSGLAVMGWIRGPAIAFGWATNSDFYIARSLKAYSFLFGVPIFNAMIMGDAIVRDFRLGIDPLIFTKPLSRAQYLFGKFFGNFLVLICSIATYPLTLLALQAFDPSQMVMQPFKILPYFTHFFFFVVLTQFAFAGVFFLAGALTRNNKLVYFLALSFYPIFISLFLFLFRGSNRGKILLDPFLLNSGPSRNGFDHSAEYLNQYVYSYTPEMILNRAGLILIAAVCLTWLYLRFTTADRSRQTSFAGVSLDLSRAIDTDTYDSGRSPQTRREHHEQALLNKPAKFKNPLQSPFFPVFQNEVRLNSRRVAPYAMMLFSIFNAALWSLGQGSSYYGQELLAKYGRLWAINSDYYIAHNFSGYALGIFGLPIFAALIMAEPVRRDFRLEIDALIFSKPVGRAQYLLGKFFGSFFVLVCCQASFAATLVLIQFVHPSQTPVLPFRLLPYFKHFLMIVVITYVLFAAVYFTVGTLTRNPKIIYGLAIAYYPLIFFYELVVLQIFPLRWRVLLSPLMLREDQSQPWGRSPEWVDRLVVSYTPLMFANRALVILAAAVCLIILYRFFSTTEHFQRAKPFSFLSLSTAAEGVYYQQSSPDQFAPAVISSVLPASAGGIKRTFSPGLVLNPPAYADGTDLALNTDIENRYYKLSNVTSVNDGLRANLNKLIASIGIEFRLLSAERSLLVVAPLAIFLCLLEVAFYPIHPDVSLTAAYASNTATSLLIFLIGMAVFYTGEAMHRDREIRIESFLWTTPVPNSVLILSKFLSTLLLLFALIVSVGVSAVVIQIIRHHTPIDLAAYVKVYGLILLPTAFILTSVSVLGNVILRNKYVFYVVSIGTAAGLLYLYNTGHNHWLYNPAMFRLWSYADLITPKSLRMILWRRAFWLVIAILSIALAHLLFQRKASTGIIKRHRSTGQVAVSDHGD
ncbi:MAG TPA: ABC transporter permease [Pyrinomonadaceae bacterium]|nr:ABC transporter permease [Pyrinomonadaceae bacterium]